MSWPNFFVVGAPKCGTTSLVGWLADHPRIFLSEVKEPNYYNTDLGNRFTESRREYESLFDGANDEHLAVGEASVWYLYSEEAVPNLLDDCPEAKLVVMFRNPVTMAYSLHDQMVAASYEHITDFREAWEAQAQRCKGSNVSWLCPDPNLLLYGPVCKLGYQLECLYQLCSRKQVLPVILDDVKKDPRREYCRVLSFLGVPDDGRNSFPVLNTAKQRRSMYVYRAMKMINKIYNKIPVLKEKRGLFGIVRRFNRWNSRERERPRMPDDMRAQLCGYFRGDISRLESLLDRDLSQWLEDVE